MTITQEPVINEERHKEEFIHGKRILSPRPTGRHTLSVSRLEMTLGGPFDLGGSQVGEWPRRHWGTGDVECGGADVDR